MPELSDAEKDEAIVRFVAATSGEHSPDQIRALEDWAGQSQARAAEIARLMALTRASRQLKDCFPVTRSAPSRLGWWATGLAATAAILALWLIPPRVIAADHRRPLTVDLADGSSIALDAGARIEISRLPWPRQVRLSHGRALFRVAHDDFTPFLVEAGEMHLRDLGTRFLVDMAGGESHVTVFEGEVEVNGRLSLRPGQAVTASAAGIEAVKAVDEDTATAWSQGRLIFKDTPLSEVAARLSLYHPRPIQVASTSVAAMRVSGVFDLSNQDGILRGLEQVLPVHIRQSEGGLLITARK